MIYKGFKGLSTVGVDPPQLHQRLIVKMQTAIATRNSVDFSALATVRRLGFSALRP